MRQFLAFWPLLLLLAGCDQPVENNNTNNDAGNNVNNVNNTDTPPEFMEFPAKVSEIVDGDTIYVRYHDQRIKIRFMGVNTPETYGTVERSEERRVGKECRCRRSPCN